MPDVSSKNWKRFGTGVGVSIVLHLLIVAAFIVRLPAQTPPTPEEQAVNVELVPPPEEKKPEENKPPAPPEEKKAEEQKPPEPPKPPEQKPDEPPKAPEPPKPPEKPPEPPKAAEEKPPEEPPKEDPPKDEAQAEDPAKDQVAPPLAALRPVFEFGDKDAGPKKSDAGDSSSGDVKPEDPTPDDTAADTAAAQAADTPPDQPPSADAAAAGAEPSDKPPVEDAQATSPLPQDIELPKVGAADTHPENDGPLSEGTGGANISLAPLASTDKPKDPTAKSAKTGLPGKLTRAKTLYSRNDTGGATAITAMNGLPRGIRAGQLCASELQQQLKHSPAISNLQIIPAYALPSGKVLEVTTAAFRADGLWYNLGFRCEIDSDAKKVQTFSFDIGSPVPRSEWKSRRLFDN